MRLYKCWECEKLEEYHALGMCKSCYAKYRHRHNLDIPRNKMAIERTKYLKSLPVEKLIQIIEEELKKDEERYTRGVK